MFDDAARRVNGFHAAPTKGRGMVAIFISNTNV